MTHKSKVKKAFHLNFFSTLSPFLSHNILAVMSFFFFLLWKKETAVKFVSHPQHDFQNESYSFMCLFFFFYLAIYSCFAEVRCQLTDQLKVLDLQLEQKSQQLQDLTDYLRRRGEIESEYARSLEKLAEKFTSRIKR